MINVKRFMGSIEPTDESRIWVEPNGLPKDLTAYGAKSAGKACYVLFDQAMHEHVTARIKLEHELRLAVKRKQFVLHCKPIVSLNGGGLEGFEALLRWNSPRLGLVAPHDFIPCCEETGLIVPIGFWVMREACRQLQQWRQRFPSLANLRISVNVSARQLCVPAFVQQVKQILDDIGISPQCLNLEITESMMIQNMESVLAVLNDLRTLGIRLELDDFGMGYSSLSLLRRLPLNGIKIDRSFVRGIGQRDDSAVIQAIITLARNLGLTLVAEGIETQGQLATLQSMNCDKGQGFYFSKPMSATQANAYIGKVVAKGDEHVDSVGTSRSFRQRPICRNKN